MCPSGIFMTVVVSGAKYKLFFHRVMHLLWWVFLSRRFAEVMYELDTDI